MTSQFQSALQLRSLVQQVTLTLAVAEAALQFEHRALTPGHVLVKETHDQVLPFWLEGHLLFVDMFGVQATVVDFSAARLLPPGGPGELRYALHRLQKLRRSCPYMAPEIMSSNYSTLVQDSGHWKSPLLM
ncbi:hypothetical protein HPB48_019452 [Haemaphysalis longicornis]|uniref:Protein kinase domain-containing protein n=1 Tax=Haemaphysalis longicornis TaxID=44386 RepID=A0A9J6FLX3_HAELO|nr:hypothetical protein HPB48_019452 [Haemaphysalis longicornis]